MLGSFFLDFLIIQKPQEMGAVFERCLENYGRGEAPRPFPELLEGRQIGGAAPLSGPQ